MGSPVVMVGGLVLLVGLIASMFGGKAQAAPLPKPDVIPSPFADVTATLWTKFVQAMASAKRPFNFVSPKGFYGIFAMGVRRLVDLKVMKDPRKVGTVWQGTWVIPQAEFLGSATIQYTTFGKSMLLYRKVIDAKYAKIIGATVEGKKASLSGLLAAAHVAGGAGLGRWLTDPAYRKKFQHVTAAYLKTTGIF